jgi:PAS domain S-box-containing protein
MDIKDILLVDDDRVAAAFITDIVVNEGFSVRHVGDGKEALDAIRLKVPDVIFTDIVMPKISGKELIRHVREMSGMDHIPIVVITGTMSEQYEALDNLPVNGIIPKGPPDSLHDNILSICRDLRESGTISRALFTETTSRLSPRRIVIELLDSLEYQETIIEKLGEGLVILDIDFRILKVNPMAAHFLEKQVTDLVGHPFSEYFSHEEKRRVESILTGLFMREDTKDKRVTVTHNNRILDLKLSSFVDRLSQKATAGLVLIEDISERKRLEAQFHKAQKMEAIGTLAGGIAHDFNNLLMSIQGYAALMLLKMDTAHPHFQKLNMIETQVEKAAKLTDQLLGFARGGKYHVGPVDFNQLVTKCTEMFGKTKREIAIHLTLTGERLIIDGDPYQVEQVLLNLYVNAWQAMPGGGDLYIETDSAFFGASEAAMMDIQPGSFARVSVRDTGVGMDQETQARIFEPFFTTKEMGRGTGLGLASVYGIVKNHQGVIEVESEPGRGSTFRIYFPLSKKIPKKARLTKSKIIKGKEAILLIDDEEMILDVGSALLTSLGYTVIKAASGKEAVDIYRNQGDAINLVILDMVMPGMGSGETYDRLKTIDPNIKVILSSGYSRGKESDAIIARGVNDFIKKPFNLETLSQKVRKVLDTP